jgi:hypothetical protein
MFAILRFLSSPMKHGTLVTVPHFLSSPMKYGTPMPAAFRGVIAYASH